MKIFADFHHDSLYYSLHMLFEKRLGWELYSPIGIDWFENKYWEIARPYGNDIRTVTQYLSPDYTTWSANQDPESKNLNYIKNGIYHIYYPHAEFYRKAITLEQFNKMNFDIVIATYIDHIDPYSNLIKKHNPSAKLIHQMGNNWAHRINFNIVKNIMASTVKTTMPKNINSVFYHQEFPLDKFHYSEPNINNKIKSFVHCMPKIDTYNKIKELLPEYTFSAHGASCPDSPINTLENLSIGMRDSMFGYHNKPGADGYGHILHNWFATGRPVIINYNEYKGTLGGNLLIPDKTCINIDNNLQTTCNKIREFSKPEKYKDMCDNSYKKFKEFVDFDKELIEIKRFLENLI